MNCRFSLCCGRPGRQALWSLLLVPGLLLGSTGIADAAVNANVVANELRVLGDGADDTITLRLVAGDATQVEVLEGAVVLGAFDRATFATILVDGGAGNDTILIDDVNGVFTDTEIATLSGGNGNDTITGGGGAETITGGDNDDVLNGRGGLDILQGNAGNDTLTGGPGGPGEEPHLGGDGDDIMVWNPGDGNDLNEGEAGNDTLVFNGSNGDEIMTVTPNAPRFTFFRNLGNITMNVGTTEILLVNALGGNDTVTATAPLAGLLTTITIEGGDGNDTLTGADLPDTLRGGAGNDNLVGGPGFDTLEGGDGNDTLAGGPGGPGFEPHIGGPGDDFMIWNPGDGNDLNEGDAGTDTLQFNGAGAAEIMAGTVNGGRVQFTRNLGNIIMDVGTTELLNVAALGGDDSITAGPGLGALITMAIDAGAGADTITSPASAIVSVIGGTENDTLNFNAEAQAVSVAGGAIAVGGVTRVTHTQVEAINILNSLSAPPTITITSPTADPTTNVSQPFITLAGTAADDVGIASVTWANDRGGSGAATGTTSWTAANIPLQAGANVVTVTAEDTNGNRASDAITVNVATLTYTLAEGSTGVFFDTDILIANPNAVVAPVSITYLKSDGTTVVQTMDLAATSRTTIEVDNIAGLEGTEVSATVTSTAGLPLVVERTMRWDDTGYGAHTEKATGGPALTWYFAEGAQGLFFDTYVLLANPGPTANVATVQFLLENAPPVTKSFDLAPTSRLTLPVGTIQEMMHKTFGMVVTFTQPGVAERAMYFGFPVFNAGHESAGVTSPSNSWFLAEGATGTFFTTFVLLANPGDTDATATLTFLPTSGVPVTKTKTIGARKRLTVNIAGEDDSLAGAAVATQVQSNVPILVERAQYWPSLPENWYEAHNSFGDTAVGTKWGLAEGRVGSDFAYQTYILLANSNTTTAADVQITFLRSNGTTVVKHFTVNPTARLSVDVNAMAPELVNESFGAIVEVTNGVGIFVERALYSNSQGVFWAAGTNALATRLP